MTTRGVRTVSSSEKSRAAGLEAALPRCVCALALGAVVVFGCGSESGTSDPTAGSSNGGASGGFGTNDGDASSSTQGCATSTKRAETLPVDIGLALDTSFSMDFDGKWINTKAALKAFVTNPAYADLGLALQFFPARKQCSVADYAQPAVSVGLLPDVSTQVSAALDAQQMDLGTPIVHVLDGMTQYMRAHAAATMNRKSILLLATDGVPDDACTGTGNGNTPNTIENAVKKAADALNGSPPIPTFVIGVGTELVALDEIAVAGGTGKAILVDPTKNVQEALLQAFDMIRKTAIPCDYEIPSSGTGLVDPKKVNVTYTAASAAPETFGFVGSAEQCALAARTGWYFDNPAVPAKVVLCPDTCERVKADDLGEVNVVFGCARNDVVR